MGMCLSAPARAEEVRLQSPKAAPTLLRPPSEGKLGTAEASVAELATEEPPLAQFARRASQVDCSKPRLLMISDNLPFFEILIRAAKESSVVIPVQYASWSLEELIAAVVLRAGAPKRQFATVGILDHGSPGEFCLLKSVCGGKLDCGTIQASEELQSYFKRLAAYVQPPSEPAKWRECLDARIDLMSCSVYEGEGRQLIRYLEDLTEVNWSASSNETGSKTDWIMESDGGLGDIAASYFSEPELRKWQFSAGSTKKPSTEEILEALQWDRVQTASVNDKSFNVESNGDVDRHKQVLEYLKSNKADKKLLKKIVKKDGWALRFAEEDLKNDKKLVLAALQAGGRLEDASPQLQEDDDVKLIAEAAEEGEGNGRENSKRASFPGNIIDDDKVTKCVASFPGTEVKKWDNVTACDRYSVACVFLTSAEDGLGKHMTPCMCHELYGKLSSWRHYVAVLEKPKTPEVGEEDDEEQGSKDEDEKRKEYEEKLEFQKANAKAMGQEFLEEAAFEDFPKELQEAKKRAKDKAKRNNYRAPWGCYWFEKWTENVRKARALGQKLHVYYMPNKKGRGELPWELLGDKEALKKAKKYKALGNSQRAEVAWLVKENIDFVKSDVGHHEFKPKKH